MSMKVILKSEVHNLGLPGDVVDVADGYGRNYLIPKGLAIRATPGAMKEAEAITRSRLAHEARTLGDAEKQAEAIESRTLRIPVRVDDAGHLYGSVSSADVQRVLKERGFSIDKRRIDLKGTIKSIGTYQIPVQVHPQVTTTATVEVVDAEGKIGVGGVLLDEVSAEELSIEEAALAAAAELEGELEDSQEQDALDGDAEAGDASEAATQDAQAAVEEPAEA